MSEVLLLLARQANNVNLQLNGVFHYLSNCNQLTATVNYFLGVGKLDKVCRIRPWSPTEICRVSWLKCRLWFGLSYETPVVFHCGLQTLLETPWVLLKPSRIGAHFSWSRILLTRLTSVLLTNDPVLTTWHDCFLPDPRSRLVSLLCGSNWNSSEINCGSTRRGSSCSSRRSDNWPNSCWRMARRSECQHRDREAAGWRHFRIFFF